MFLYDVSLFSFLYDVERYRIYLESVQLTFFELCSRVRHT